MKTGGAGGGAGGVIVCNLTSFGAAQCVIIGNGGIGGVGGSSVFGTPTCPGSPGGSSCFGALVISSGGAGGQAGSAAFFNPPTRYDICTPGGAGGNSSPNGAYSLVGCLVNGNASGGAASGKPGSGGAAFGKGWCSCSSNATSGGGGSTICGITLGSGGAGGPNATIGSNGSGFGAGGGGGSLPVQYFCNSKNGGAGAAGIIQVTQYFS
jgi:hypothetical protein